MTAYQDTCYHRGEAAPVGRHPIWGVVCAVLIEAFIRAAIAATALASGYAVVRFGVVL